MCTHYFASTFVQLLIPKFFCLHHRRTNYYCLLNYSFLNSLLASRTETASTRLIGRISRPAGRRSIGASNLRPLSYLLKTTTSAVWLPSSTDRSYYSCLIISALKLTLKYVLLIALKHPDVECNQQAPLNYGCNTPIITIMSFIHFFWTNTTLREIFVVKKNLQIFSFIKQNTKLNFMIRSNLLVFTQHFMVFTYSFK